MNPFPFAPLTSVPPPADDSPVARLAHTLAIFDEDPARRPADDRWALTATTYAYPGGPERTGLTWGDLRALHADLTACAYCLTACGHPEQCGAALDSDGGRRFDEEDDVSDNPGLRAAALTDAIGDAMVSGPSDWNSAEAELRPVVAVTPHGSYTFAVDAAEWDGQRIVLRLREIHRKHELRLSVRSPNVWVECSCGFAQGVGAWPKVEHVREVAKTHRATS